MICNAKSLAGINTHRVKLRADVTRRFHHAQELTKLAQVARADGRSCGLVVRGHRRHALASGRAGHHGFLLHLLRRSSPRPEQHAGWNAGRATCCCLGGPDRTTADPRDA